MLAQYMMMDDGATESDWLNDDLESGYELAEGGRGFGS